MMMKLLLVEDATIYLILLQKLLEDDFQITLSKNIADAKEIIGDQDYRFDGDAYRFNYRRSDGSYSSNKKE